MNSIDETITVNSIDQNLKEEYVLLQPVLLHWSKPVIDWSKCVKKLARFITLSCYLEVCFYVNYNSYRSIIVFWPDSITAQVLAAKRATGFNYSVIQLQQYSITAEFNYIPQYYNQPNRALDFTYIL